MKMKYNLRSKAVILLAVLLLAVSALAGPLTPDRAFSEHEKRTLAEFPIFDAEEFFSGDFSSAFEDYLTDQVPLRDDWITVKTFAEMAAGKHESGGVYIAKDKYLMDKFTGYNKKLFTANAEAVASLQAYLTKRGISMYTMAVPVAAQVLTDKLPAYAPVASYEKMLALLQDAGLQTVDVKKVLDTHTDENIYYRTDHHWTSLGAYYAYCEWMNLRGSKAAPESCWTKKELCSNFRGTTWNKVPLPTIPAESITAWYRHENHSVSYNNGDYETNSIYEKKYLKGSDQYAVFLNSNQAQTVISGSGDAGSGRLLLLKDSYGNTFSQFACEDFEEVHVIDLRFFLGDIRDYIQANGITDVLVLYGIQNFASDVALPSLA